MPPPLSEVSSRRENWGFDPIMPEYHYSARNEFGQRFAGSLEAQNKTEAMQLLSERFNIVTRLEEKTSTRLVNPFKPTVSGEAMLTFCQTLATMLEGGITLKRALDTMYGDTESRALRNIIIDVSSQLGTGAAFSTALESHRPVFDDFFISMVRAGEDSGELPQMLHRVATFREKTEALKDTVKSALTYPIVVLCFAALMVFLILAFGIPYLSNLYEGLGIQLPFATQVMVDFGMLLGDNILLTLIILAVGAFLFQLYLRSPLGRMTLDRMKLHAPILKDLFRLLYTARFARTLGILYSSGIPLLGALDLTANSVGNNVIAAELEKTKDGIRAGGNLADCLRYTPYFLDSAIGMVAAGEESGRLDHMLSKIADFYEHKVYTRFDTLAATIEPLMMVGVGICIGTIIITLGLPFMTLASAF